MSAETVYQLIDNLVQQGLPEQVPPATKERLALLVMGILGAKSASPARIARALALLGLTQASAESCERRIRRIENDPQVTAAVCFHPFAKLHLALGKPKRLLLVVDPTCQEARVVLLSIAVWYRGRALPLCWAVWPGNTKLEGDRFWQRLHALLEEVATLLPRQVEVIWLADRAFGTPVFLDALSGLGWHFVVRVQDQTRYREATRREQAVRTLVTRPGQRVKRRGALFKKSGWRGASVVVFWGAKHKSPLCLVSDLPPSWALLALYRRRYPIEASFRDYKSAGWQWEQGQVTDLEHIRRLLVGMALSTWVAVLAGAAFAQSVLAERATGQRHTRCWWGKYRLFQLGVDYLHRLLYRWEATLPMRGLPDWEAPNWQEQIHAHHARPYVLGRVKQKPLARWFRNVMTPVRP